MTLAIGRGELQSCGQFQSYSDINLTPLIDIMLVLLIIFIVTIPPQTHAVKIGSPLSDPDPRTAVPEVIDVSIDFDGTLRWNDHAVDRARLQAYIGRDARKTPLPEVHITVDKFARYQVVAQTVADLQQGGLRRIGFLNNDN